MIVIYGIEVDVKCGWSGREEWSPLPVIVLRIKQEIRPHDCHTNGHDDQNYKHKQHESVYIVYLSKNKTKYNQWVTAIDYWGVGVQMKVAVILSFIHIHTEHKNCTKRKKNLPLTGSFTNATIRTNILNLLTYWEQSKIIIIIIYHKSSKTKMQHRGFYMHRFFLSNFHSSEQFIFLQKYIKWPDT